jgi:hypothetical protein
VRDRDTRQRRERQLYGAAANAQLFAIGLFGVWSLAGAAIGDLESSVRHYWARACLIMSDLTLLMMMAVV